MRKIGILGGTFDPPHLGHLIIAEEVRISLGLDGVWFMPSNEPPHKEKAISNTKERLQMLALAIENNAAFKINTVELNRKGKSYTVDTIKILKENYSKTEFYFIIGADMVEYLPHWKRIDDLVNMVKFVGVKRSGFPLKSSYSILTVDIPMIDISSTVIRERLTNNQSVKYLVPEKVDTYIKENQLYEN